MIFDFILSECALGFDTQGQVRALDPSRLCDDPRGLSGTEVNALGLAHALAAKGHVVRLYSFLTSPGLRIVKMQDNLWAYDMRAALVLEPATVAIAFHDSRPLAAWRAQYKIAWHQTLAPPFAEHLFHPSINLYLSATMENAVHLCDHYAPQGLWGSIPNGWDFGEYPVFHEPIPGRLVYHTSAERGLWLLLEALPTIKAAVPETHLEIYCRRQYLTRCYPAVAQAITKALYPCQAYVTWHEEGVSRNAVLRALSAASVFAYPSEPPQPCEVMPMAVAEACALRVPVVTAPSSHFEDVFRNAGLMLCPTPPSEHLDIFAEHVIAMLTRPELQQKARSSATTWASAHTFSKLSEELLTLIRGF